MMCIMLNSREIINEYIGDDGIEIIVMRRPSIFNNYYIYHIIKSHYHNNGLEVGHRINGPSYIKYTQSSIVLSERWYHHGQIHRDNGPAETDYYDNNSKYIERWFINGRCHNLHQPSIIIYNRLGMISEYYWFCNDIECSDSVNSIICSMGLPMDWREWGTDEQLLFKLSMVDIISIPV